MRSKKYRLQRDSVVAMSVSMVLFIKLLVKTCEVVQSSSSSVPNGKRLANTLDVDHLSRSVKRYEVLSFMEDLLAEVTSNPQECISIGSVDKVIEETDAAMICKRKQVELVNAEDDEASTLKKVKGSSSQSSITSFFQVKKVV